MRSASHMKSRKPIQVLLLISIFISLGLIFLLNPPKTSAQSCGGYWNCCIGGLCCDPPQCTSYTCHSDFQDSCSGTTQSACEDTGSNSYPDCSENGYSRCDNDHSYEPGGGPGCTWDPGGGGGATNTPAGAWCTGGHEDCVGGGPGDSC